ncbi:MAG: toll/interleukin-1 receptor domain-containing protein [Anaerolineales bacterium]
MAETNPPKVFISYAWEDDLKPWVRKLAKSLRKDGIDVQLDDWELSLGDQLPVFMEKAVRESDFVIFICTPKYKTKSDERKGGVGYEGHIITAEIFGKSNDRKFIPVLRAGKWESSSPSWAGAKNYLDLSGEPYSKTNYKKLVKTLHGKKPGPPPIGAPPGFLDEDEEEENEATREKARKETAEKARLKAEDEERERIAKEKAEREAEEKARQKPQKKRQSASCRKNCRREGRAGKC